MATSKTIKEIIKEQNDCVLFLQDIFDRALVGTGKQCGRDIVPVYDSTVCLNILIDKFDMEELEALEHFQHVVDGGSAGEYKPIFINDFRKMKNIDINDIDEDTTLENFFQDI